MPAIKPEDYPIEPHSEFRVVWSGTTTRLKGLDIAIAGCRKAREAIPSLRLHVVGLCSKESQSEEWVRFYGLVDREVARGIVANADVFLTTSRYDSFPIAILEAFALGVPVIGSPPSAWLVRGIGTAVDDLDPASYALALENVFKMPPARESLLLQANTLRQRFDWDAIARSYCEQIAAIVSSNASAGAQPKGKRGQYA
jgi:glycosyltransferase involved in cell wall biosynthesis